MRNMRYLLETFLGPNADPNEANLHFWLRFGFGLGCPQWMEANAMS